jgi:hypothetical protein
MAWSSPMTAVANAALTAAQWNTHVRDNLLETAPAKATSAGQIFVATGANSIAARTIGKNRIDTTQTTTSSSYVDLATIGPTVTVTTSTRAIAIITAQMNASVAGNYCVAGCEVSGATSISPDDAESLNIESGSNFMDMRASALVFYDTLNPGSNTFRMKYLVSGSTGTFQRRILTVIPL